MAKREPFDHLSDEERAVVGDPVDYDWANAVKADPAPRRRTTQFSLRADEVVVQELAALAAVQGMTFSEVVREALVTYIHAVEAKTSVTGTYSLANASAIFHSSVRGGWSQTRTSVPSPVVSVHAGDSEIEVATTSS